MNKLSVNHKGQTCIVSLQLCQEGYCKECEIYKMWLNNPDKIKVK
jgi:hypothetical protein